MQTTQSRRRFMAGLSAVATTGLSLLPQWPHAEPPLETTTVRLPRWVGSGYCWAAEYIAGELMRADGLTDVRWYVIGGGARAGAMTFISLTDLVEVFPGEPG